MSFSIGKAHSRLIIMVIVFFVISLLTSYIILSLTIQRTYSIPSYEGNYTSFTQGGDALGGPPEGSGFGYVGVFVGPRPGAINVSLDSVIYADQMRPVSVDLHVSPEVPIERIKEEHVGIASRVTVLCLGELLQPDTTYNVSGYLMGLSAWWTFTTGSSVIPQPEQECLLYPYEMWGFAIIASCIATSIFAVIIRHYHKLTKNRKESVLNKTHLFHLVCQKENVILILH